ncbi:protein KHNYN-like [Phyllobates terribilis]|uniref:protein KHNYN-like n=1 Tax=Phyllobates terribilis TaxID=111132 RepID=UPI003CCB64DD
MLMAVGEYEAAHDSGSMDEFAVPQGPEKKLRDQHPNIERIFGIAMNILGVLSQDPLSLQSTAQQQMWVQLQGDKRNIAKAKDYIKGLCTPELIEDLDYPREMHCIFVGARGLFLDCLIRATSACVNPQTPGRIRISGLVEEVVMAQSRIHIFLDDHISKADCQEASIKRNFKDLVEKHNDQHSLDLLILPTSIKEQLLFLVEEDKDFRVKHPITQERLPMQTSDTAMSNQPFFTAPAASQPMAISKSKSTNGILRHRASEPRDLITEAWDNSRQPMHLSYKRPTVQENLHYTNSTDTWENSRQPMNLSYNKRPTVEENLHYTCSKHEERPTAIEKVEPSDEEEEEEEEFKQISGLLDTIMGKDEREPGSQTQFSLGTQKEFKMLLDFFKTMGYQESVVLKVLHENGIQEPSEILDKVNMEQSCHDQTLSQKNRPSTLRGISHSVSSTNDDSYLLEVMKSAAKNCGYSPSEIVDIGDGSVTGLLRKLNEKNNSGDFPMTGKARGKEQEEEDLWLQETAAAQSHPELIISDPTMVQFKAGKHKTFKSNFPEDDLFDDGAQDVPEVIEEVIKREDKEKHNIPVVTGAQRFNEAIQKPFTLNLRNKKGNDQLRHIIIDGSNVAKIHGLHCYFSCRGIALAVQYFWDRGHRNITVLVPQWRLKNDSKAKEQQFLTELNDLGLLAFTPSRTVEGKRITSYDDRFMLHLAERTDGVIVTNDFLRDMFAESHAWQNIIKNRLLQFTFAGDIFMIPDDPLGRNGPALDKFLKKNSLPKPKSKGHSFAGRRAASAYAQPKPSSQTEVLNLRDRKPVGYKERENTGVRSHTETERLRCELLSIFPLQDMKVDFILQKEPCLNDLNKLSELFINLKF